MPKLLRQTIPSAGSVNIGRRWVPMQVIKSVGAGVLGICGALLGARELQAQASGRGGKKGLMVLAFALCAAAVLISQA
ncbi:hypothetical protein ABZ379_17735 [Streptomyces canus]|uniref:hypothetical protein n=1 Tax=Streptomyces canus TaxID=58343 RepID=UPI0033C9C80F